MNKIPTPPERPHTDDPEAWHTYWETQNQLWRIMPEIDHTRQEYLYDRLNGLSAGEESYPFKDVVLNRADVEWLLITYKQGQQPRLRSHGQLQRSDNLDLRAATLQKVDMRGLPLGGVDL